MSCFGVHQPPCCRNCAVCCPEADAGQAKHWLSSKPACSWSYAPKVLQKQCEEAQSWAPGCYLCLSYCVTLSSSLHLWVTALPPQLPGSGMATPTSSARVSCGAILQLIECRKRVFSPHITAALQWFSLPVLPCRLGVWLNSLASTGCFVPCKCRRKYLQNWDSCEKFYELPHGHCANQLL